MSRNLSSEAFSGRPPYLGTLDVGTGLDERGRHVASAMAVLGARSKLEAVVRALDRGLIDLLDG